PSGSLNRIYKIVYLMMLFQKEEKKIVIDGYLFNCFIDQTPENEMISFKIYPSIYPVLNNSLMKFIVQTSNYIHIDFLWRE
ncbi:hypothetical protein, partial [Paenibacillus alginolyticus]